MSHRDREHAPGAAERGSDWLDGALAGWLLFIAISTSPYAWHAIREGAGAPTVAYELAAPVLAVAAIFPLLSFKPVGWILAALVLGLMVVRSGMTIVDPSTGWRAAAAFLAVHLAGLAYLVWIIPEFWPRHAEDDAAPAPRADAVPADAASPSPAVRAEEAVSATPSPVTQALAALHHRIVAAGSACAVAPVAVRAEAGRFGVTPAALRTEGLALYRTFLEHFLDDGPLTPDEERELICLERALDLDDDGVWRLRAEAGLVGGPGAPAPILSVVHEPALEVVANRALASGDDGHRTPRASDRNGVSGDADHPLAESLASDRRDASVDADHPPAESFASDRDSVSDDADHPLAESFASDRDGVSDDADHPPVEPFASDRRDASVDADHPPADEAAHVNIPSEADDLPADEAAHVIIPGAADDLANVVPADSADGFRAPPPADDAPPVDAADLLEDYEEHELGALLAWAGIGRLPADTERRVALERLRALHLAVTGPLETCDADQPLDAGERCLAVRTVELHRAGADPAATVADVPGPVLPPLHLLDGSLEAERDLSGFQRTGLCTLLVTDRRLLLVAPSGQQSPLPVSRVREVRPFGNGIQVQPRRGGPVFLAFRDGVADVAMRIDRAARDLRPRA